MLGRAAEYKANETGLHVLRMSHYAELIARAMGGPDDECELIKLAAPMHDIGKIGIADGILTKPARPTAEEFEQIKRHPQIGVRIIADSEVYDLAAVIALTHHPRKSSSTAPTLLLRCCGALSSPCSKTGSTSGQAAVVCASRSAFP